MRQDSNPQPFESESSLLSTRPGFRPCHQRYLFPKLRIIAVQNKCIKDVLYQPMQFKTDKDYNLHKQIIILPIYYPLRASAFWRIMHRSR